MPLPRRVTLAFTLLGLMLSLAFSFAALAITEDYEHVLANEILRGQADDYALRLANGLPAQLPQTHRLSGYLDRVPAAYASLAPGVHEDRQREGVHVGVYDTAAGRLYFVINLGDIERLEQHLDIALAAIVVLGTLASGWLGWLLARRVLAPVGSLAGAVDALPLEARPTHLAAHAGADDLGRLAEAIDRYQGRLTDAANERRAFFADASHELRTPVAVVQGAAELLREDAVNVPAMTPRLERLDRGVGDLADLLEILMRLARGQRGDAEDVDARVWTGAVLKQALSRFAPAVQVDVESAPDLRWRLAGHDARLVLRVAARHAIAAGAAGTLAVRCDALGVEFGAPAEPAGPSLSRRPHARSDRDFSASLVGRLAAVHGWSVSGSGNNVRVDWSAEG